MESSSENGLKKILRQYDWVILFLTIAMVLVTFYVKTNESSANFVKHCDKQEVREQSVDKDISEIKGDIKAINKGQEMLLLEIRRGH